MMHFGKIEELKELKWRDPSGDVFIIHIDDQSANRTAAVPALSTDDTFVFCDQPQTLTNKTIPLGQGNSVMGITDQRAEWLAVTEDVQAFMTSVKNTTGIGQPKGNAWLALSTSDIQNLAGTTSSIQAQFGTNETEHGLIEGRLTALEAAGGSTIEEFTQATIVNVDQATFGDTAGTAMMVFAKNENTIATTFQLRTSPIDDLTYVITNAGTDTLEVDAGTELIEGESTLLMQAGAWIWLRWDGTEWYVAARSGTAGTSSSAELVEMTASQSDASAASIVFVQCNSATAVTFEVAAQADGEKIYQFKNHGSGTLTVDLSTNCGGTNTDLAQGAWVWLLLKTAASVTTVYVMDESVQSSASQQFEFTSGEAIAAGDAVYVNTEGKVVKATKTSTEAARFIGDEPAVTYPDFKTLQNTGRFAVTYFDSGLTKVEVWKSSGGAIAKTSSPIPAWSTDTIQRKMVDLLDGRFVFIYQEWAGPPNLTICDLYATTDTSVTRLSTRDITSESITDLDTLRYQFALSANMFALIQTSVTVFVIDYYTIANNVLTPTRAHSEAVNAALLQYMISAVTSKALLFISATWLGVCSYTDNSIGTLTKITGLDHSTYTSMTGNQGKWLEITTNKFITVGFRDSGATMVVALATWNGLTGSSATLTFTEQTFVVADADANMEAYLSIHYESTTSRVLGSILVDRASGNLCYYMDFILTDPLSSAILSTPININTAYPTLNLSDTASRLAKPLDVSQSKPIFDLELCSKPYLTAAPDYFRALEYKRCSISSAAGATTFALHDVISTSSKFLGFSRSTVAAADLPVQVAMGPVVTNLSGLTAYKYYYSAGNGLVSTINPGTGNEYLVGLAVSTTSMLVKAFGV